MEKAYQALLDELTNFKYLTWKIGDFFFGGNLDEESVNVPLRIDFDYLPEAVHELGPAFEERTLEASLFFLPSVDREIVDYAKEFKCFEVGLHSDHGARGLGVEEVKRDIKRLGLEDGGVTFHGDALNSLVNWRVYNDVVPGELGVDWHDGCKGYLNEGAFYGDWDWRPPCSWVSDHMLVNNAWHFVPGFPVDCLRSRKPGDVLHVIFHGMFSVCSPAYCWDERAARWLQANAYAFKKRRVV